MDTKETRQVLLEGIQDGTIRPLEALKLHLLVEILDELRAIREATETEAVEDADPEPFQTLNGPKTINGDGHSTVFSYPEGTTISEP